MQALLDDLADEFGHLRMFRPNRDARFSKDKSPYKLWVGATSESRAVGATGYYIEVSATRLITGFGAMLMARDQLERFRAALDDEQSARGFVELYHALAAESLPLISGIEPPFEDRTPRIPRGPSPRGVPALEGRRHRPGVRQSRLECTPRRHSTGSTPSGAARHHSKHGSTPTLEHPRHPQITREPPPRDC
jgi:uncharacterized protein (DUF2461 family)